MGFLDCVDAWMRGRLSSAICGPSSRLFLQHRKRSVSVGAPESLFCGREHEHTLLRERAGASRPNETRPLRAARAQQPDSAGRCTPCDDPTNARARGGSQPPNAYDAPAAAASGRGTATAPCVGAAAVRCVQPSADGCAGAAADALTTRVRGPAGGASGRAPRRRPPASARARRMQPWLRDSVGEAGRAGRACGHVVHPDEDRHAGEGCWGLLDAKGGAGRAVETRSGSRAVCTGDRECSFVDRGVVGA